MNIKIEVRCPFCNTAMMNSFEDDNRAIDNPEKLECDSCGKEFFAQLTSIEWKPEGER
jgi:DNA-directed RNA polymerase subunit M/transcription elongation factor TFIIS